MSSLLPRGVDHKHNHRKFPGAKGKRPDRKELRRMEAMERAKVYAALPIEEKMKRNPKRYMNTVH
jgi:hypothetical protein